MKTLPPPPKKAPFGAWSKKHDRCEFSPTSHFCSHCRQEIPDGGRLWATARGTILCRDCVSYHIPSLLN